MNNISKEANKVLESIRLYGPVRSVQLVSILNISMKTLYKHLSKLLDNQLIKKIGTTPKVFYTINDVSELKDNFFNEVEYII